MNPKHPLFLTYYNKITAITGSVPPSPREKALVREESNIKNSLLPGSSLHIFIRSAQVFLGDVGAHPCVRPDRKPLFSLDKTV